MKMNKNFTDVTQIGLGLVLIALIIIQSRGGGLGSSFGSFIGGYRSKRGLERLLQILTILVSLVFFLVAFLNFYFFS